jgi:hypothetical protein
MTQQFKPGTKVHVEFDAIVDEPREFDFIKRGSGGLHEVSEYGGGYGFLKVRDTKNGLYHYVWASSWDNDDLITTLTTPDWEKYHGAEVGDIWESNDREYFAYNSFGERSPSFRLTVGSGTSPEISPTNSPRRTPG